MAIQASNFAHAVSNPFSHTEDGYSGARYLSDLTHFERTAVHMSLQKPAVTVAVLLVLCGCGSSSSTSNSSRTDEIPATGAAQPSPGSGAITVSGGVQNESDSGSTDGSSASGVDDSGAGDENNGSVTGADNPESQRFYIDPTSAEFIESDSRHFRNALLGAWAATECRELETVFSQPESAHSVFVFTETELVETEYSYYSADCTGIPSSKWYPLPIRSWTLGVYRTLLDGTGAWELDTTITQRGVYGGEVLNSVGGGQLR